MQTPPKKNLLKLNRITNECLNQDEYLRLDKNENLKGFSDKALQDIQKIVTSDFLTAYPDAGPLYKKLAQCLNIPQEQIYLSAGSDAGIKAVFEVYVEPADEVVIIHPTYAMYYVYSKMFDARLIEIDFDENLALPAEKIIEKISPKTKLICIANPNSPTGTIIPLIDLKKIIGIASENGTLVLVDEAYYQFWGYSAIDMVSEYDNLIIVRTFSKALGLASARLGYLASTPEIVSHLFRVRPMYEVNAFAVSLGLYMLEHPDITVEYVNEIDKSRKWLKDELSIDGINIAQGFANFVLIDVRNKEKAAQIAKSLLNEKIVIKGGFCETCLKPYIRVGLGTMDQMKYFLEKFRKILLEIA
jgi:histidinol-phosphate aminotransferase